MLGGVDHTRFCRRALDDGLRFSRLITWWRAHEGLADEVSVRDSGLNLHRRLRASSGDNPVEQRVFDAYARQFRGLLDTRASIPHVYLHYDPLTQRGRQSWGQGPGPPARQRMNFLLLFSNHHRVVLEVDGKQHYADNDGTASPTRYARMVAEDRRLRLAGDELYRFAGAELMAPGAVEMLGDFFGGCPGSRGF